MKHIHGIYLPNCRCSICGISLYDCGGYDLGEGRGYLCTSILCAMEHLPQEKRSALEILIKDHRDAYFAEQEAREKRLKEIGEWL